MDYWFSVKKLLSIYLNPVTVTLELVFLGVVLIGLASRKPRKPLGPKMTRLRAHLGDLGVFFVILGILALFFASIDPVANALTLHLERQHPPLKERDGVTVVTTAPAAIVVLAGGQRNAPEKPVLSSLTRQGLARIVGGVDLWKRFPDSKFIVTGHPDETSAMRAVAQRLGVPTPSGAPLQRSTNERGTYPPEPYTSSGRAMVSWPFKLDDNAYVNRFSRLPS